MGAKLDKKKKRQKEREMRRHLNAKQKFIKFVQSTPLYRDVDKKEIAQRKREAIEHMKFLEKNKVTKQEIKKWLKDVPKKNKQQAMSIATTMLAGSVPVFHMAMMAGVTDVAQAVQPIAGAVEPYFIPLMAIGVGLPLAHDIWHLKSMKHVRLKLKELGKWTDHEIEMIINHLRHHKKKKPRMMHGVSKHHVKKLHKVM
ncbi:MAG: hypothetical protein PVI03_01405 [Candidatus Thorarchaeota archaeon]